MGPGAPGYAEEVGAAQRDKPGGAAMEGQGPYAEDQGTKAPGSPGAEGQPDQGVSSAPAAVVPAARGGGPARRRKFAAGLIGAIGVSIVSLLFIVSFIGALHDPGPRSVPVGLVGTHTQA